MLSVTWHQTESQIEMFIIPNIPMQHSISSSFNTQFLLQVYQYKLSEKTFSIFTIEKDCIIAMLAFVQNITDIGVFHSMELHWSYIYYQTIDDPQLWYACEPLSLESIDVIVRWNITPDWTIIIGGSDYAMLCLCLSMFATDISTLHTS